MALKALFSEVEIITQYPMVGLAIVNSTAPVPGYLYGEINAITYIDNGKHCKSLVSFLVARLQADTPLVSVKVLKLLLYLVKNGHNEVVEEVKHHEVALKEARRFSGPPDDLHGSSFYENIRKMAKELLDVIFSGSKETTENMSLSGYSEMVGYGSSSNVKKMSGFGHSIKSQKSVSEIVTDSFTGFVEKLISSDDKDTPLPPSHLGNDLPKYKPLVIGKSMSEYVLPVDTECTPPTQLTSTKAKSQRKKKVHKPGRPGGGWDESEEEDDAVSVAVQEENCKISSMSADSLENSKTDTQPSADWLEEQRVIDELCVNEPLNKLQYSTVLSVCKRCSSLNCDKILDALSQKFFDKEENIQLRALVFVEYLLFHDIVTLESLAKIVVPPLQLLTDADQDIGRSVKLKAKKISLIVKNLSTTHPSLQAKNVVTTDVPCHG